MDFANGIQAVHSFKEAFKKLSSYIGYLLPIKRNKEAQFIEIGVYFGKMSLLYSHKQH